jgi:hypothetical protein
MSLQKSSCEKCWLPAALGKTLCRKCKGPPSFNINAWIRYHTPSESSCTKYRKLINEDTYYGSVIPQDCIHCCSFLLEKKGIWEIILRKHTHQTSYADLSTLFVKSIEREKSALLEYVNALLILHQEDLITCNKIVNALISASNGRCLWILEELVLRPSMYDAFLFAPIQLPSHIPEDFYGYFETMEDWWAFWEKIPAAAQRRVKFRCMKFKDELIEKAWAPERVLRWCLDIETRTDIHKGWYKSIQ